MPRKVDTSIHKASTLEYWNSAAASNDGMLDGQTRVSPIDLEGSMRFLRNLQAKSKLHPPSKGLSRAVDCGAGIGRVTLGFLSKVAEKVDIVEPVEKFTKEIQNGDACKELRETDRLGDIFNIGVEKFEPAADAYDLIWNQWCLLYLKDAELVRYLQRCKNAIRKGGWIVAKENVIIDKKASDVYDEVDSSVTRTDQKYKSLFAQAGLKLVAAEVQGDWPDDLFPVVMYALQPQ